MARPRLTRRRGRVWQKRRKRTRLNRAKLVLFGNGEEKLSESFQCRDGDGYGKYLQNNIKLCRCC